MSQPIIVIIGERSAGKILAQAADRVDADSAGHDNVSTDYNSAPKRRTHVITYYYSSDRAVSTIDKALRRQMAKLATAKNIARILFVYSDKSGEATGFPFGTGTRFLNLEGKTLFQRLIVVVQSRPDNDKLKREWSDLVKAGMRVAIFDGTQDSARVFVAPTVQKMQGDPAQVSELQDIPKDLSRSASFAALTGDRDGPPRGDRALLADKPIDRYIKAGLATGRHTDQAVILLVGNSGHGKSKTINRLLGQELLKVGKSRLESTTKDIQRVKVSVLNHDTGVTLTLAFDDTPGYADTSHNDRASNSALIKIYKARYFPETRAGDSSSPQVRQGTYPNVILLVASWDSITPDAHNEPHHFTSPIGQSMHKLVISGLVDHSRTNVVIVVTKAMSYWGQFDDFKTIAEKNNQWKIEAARRIRIITDLQRKVFPRLEPWRTVFVENGGGSDMRAKYPILPNGELSHQNLFKAICSVIEKPGPRGTSDLAGLHALGALTGAEPLTSPREREILVSRGETATIIDSETRSMDLQRTPRSSRIHELADSFLGVTYNPIWGHFGRKCVLDLQPSDIHISNGPDGQIEQFTYVADLRKKHTTVTDLLHCAFDMPDVAGLSAHYSSSHDFQSSWSANSQLYEAQHVTATATVRPLRPPLSKEMVELIAELPRWSESSDHSKQQYNQFFSSYGTHVVLRLALGGNLRVIMNGLQNVKDHHGGRGIQGEAGVPVLNGFVDIGAAAGHAQNHKTHDLKGRREITILREGGGSIAGDFTRILENHFKQCFPSPEVPTPWPGPDVREDWIKALEIDPTFVADSNLTQYMWLYALSGLSKQQKNDLKLASEFYLRMRHKQRGSAAPPQNLNRRRLVDDLPRERNSQGIRQKIKNFFSRKKK